MDGSSWLVIAAVIQGGAAVVVAVLTHRLVKATREYVSLTHELAKAARTQQDVHAAQSAADYDRVSAFVEQFREKALRLPEGIDTANRMLDAGVLWTDEELADLSRLAANQGLALVASRAIDHLRWLGYWVREMELESKQTGLGIRWKRVPWDDWATHLTGALEALNRLHDSTKALLEKGTLGNLVERAGG